MFRSGDERRRSLLASIARRSIFGAVCVAALFTHGAAHAQSVADFYKGRTVNLVIGYSVGGGYDLYGRLLARYIDRYIPGNPTVVPQSMPGAGSLKAAMYLYAVAPKDGTVIGTFGRTIPLEPLISGAKFDPRKMGWLGSVTSDISLCVTSQASPIKTWDDLMTKSARMGGQASGSDPDNFAQLLKNLFGSNLRLITGFPGNNELALAMERNEIDGYCGLSWSSLVSQHPDWIKEKKVNYIVQAGMSKESPLPDTPTLMSRTNDPRKLAVLKMIVATQALARPFATSPDLPQERLAALQEAFARTTADPEFLAEAQKLGLDVSPVEGAKISAMLDEVYAMPQDVVELARQAEGH